MRAGDLPEAVRRLIAEHIDSVEQLEILLLLHQHPERSWTAESVARELRISPLSAGDRLKDMARAAILARVQGSEAEYRYAPESPQMGEAVSGLAAAYSERRVTVINLIFSKPVDKIRTFADAFRLRKDADDDNG
ncbi:MAG TPA: hypothetical protein VFZ09_41040 [Archangium sp.]|uniref:hypothetical protein n=1 Tax=Archangium sp. TaxID=1872627 RepID=UPI002E2EB090|nr:hypothetical protein [Archangium sp.]HEX5752662.1 hypothetical protein [Archangium sp.]